MKKTKIFEVYEDRGRIYTVNLVRGKTVYGEKLVGENNVEYLFKSFKFLFHSFFQITFSLIQLLNYHFLINYENGLDSFTGIFLVI